ncbi:MAG: mucoidy inhibitor MuiA family protein [Propionibacteriaceae bacterium]|jgi:uncharacterized protein (TIGR02231 family)|nr:mucoidy inhibitor MuiA family protein [Propionibacteriaceae bacterium]
MKNSPTTATPIDSTITAATVYLSGAHITRSAELPLAAGVHQLVFGALPAWLNPQSIQVSASGGVQIGAVEHLTNHIQRLDYSAEITALKDQLEDLEDDLAQAKSQISLGELEEGFFAENRRLAGTKAGLKAEELKAAVLFYNERMATIRQARFAREKQIKELTRAIQNLKAQLGSFRATADPVSEIHVTVAAEEATEATLTVSYYVDTASWQPRYDIRVNQVGGDVALEYKAAVSQNTGENWTDIALTLSTGNPSLGGVCPELNPWYIDFYRPPLQRQRAVGAAAPKAMRAMAQDMMEMEVAAAAPMDAALPPPPAAVVESVTSVEYALTAPQTIASGDDSGQVAIATHRLPAQYRYRCVPKMNRETFLLASVSGWQAVNLIAGEAAVFFRDRYVGSTVIDPSAVEDAKDLELSLGTDNAVLVTRERGKDYTATTAIVGSVKQSRQWELTVRNLKSVAITIDLLDQIPVPVNKRITVDTNETSGAEIDKDKGILTWKLTLEPGQSKLVTYKYTVTSPSDGTVRLD